MSTGHLFVRENFVLLFRILLAVAVLGLANIPACDAADDTVASIDPAHNPLLGTWLLSAEVVNPNLPTRCVNKRFVLTPTSQTRIDGTVRSEGPARYAVYGPKAMAIYGSAGYRIYTIIDHDHIMLDEIPRCTWQRGALNGTTPLLEKLALEAQPAPAPAPAEALTNDADLRRSMDELGRAIHDLQEKARQQDGDQ